MRRTVTNQMLVGLFGAALAFAGAGCIIVVGARDHDDHEIIEVDGEMYIVDQESGRAKRVQSKTETPESTSEKPSGNTR